MSSDKPQTTKNAWLWNLAERAAWDNWFPAFFWCWLLKRLDRQNGYEFDYD